jgi:hypothetical protein
MRRSAIQKEFRETTEFWMTSFSGWCSARLYISSSNTTRITVVNTYNGKETCRIMRPIKFFRENDWEVGETHPFVWSVCMTNTSPRQPFLNHFRWYFPQESHLDTSKYHCMYLLQVHKVYYTRKCTIEWTQWQQPKFCENYSGSVNFFSLNSGLQFSSPRCSGTHSNYVFFRLDGAKNPISWLGCHTISTTVDMMILLI